MRTYPLIVVDGCESPEDAVAKAEDYAFDLMTSHVYDSGGPAQSDDIETRESLLPRAGTQEYRGLVEEALSTERAAVREHWTVLRQALERFGQMEDPPDLEERFETRYKLALGIRGISKAGDTVNTSEPFWMVLWRAGKLYDLLDGQPDTSRCLYDVREDQSLPVADDSRDGVYAVRCDFHF